MSELLRTNNTAQLLLLFVTTLLACAKVTIQSKACRKYLVNTRDSLVYNTMFFALVAFFLGIMFPQTAPAPKLVLLSTLSAIANVTFQVVYSMCLVCGPVSLTVLIVNFSVLIPTFFSAVLFREQIFASQLLGIAFLLVSMFLSVRKTKEEKGISKKWFILTIIALFSTGIAACIQKFFYKTELANVENASNTFLFLVYAIGTILIFFVQFLWGKTGKKEKCTFWFSKKLFLYVLLNSVIISVFQKLFMVSTEYINGSVLYPTYNGLQAVVMGIIGVVFFGDKLSKKQKLGMILGIASIVLMNIKFGWSFSF